MSLSRKRLNATAEYITGVQLRSGALPWFADGIVDPWDHVEALMGLTAAGNHTAAALGFEWLAATQRDDGAWYAAYNDTEVADDTRAETNFVAYPATGLWHHYLVTGNDTMLKRYWPMIAKAMNFVMDLQTDEGEIYWAVDTRKGISRDALITGCSSIYKSLDAAINIAQLLGENARPYQQSRERLGEAIRHKPHRFDRTWESKARYSMDWFYPVLTGVFTAEQATQRIDQRWHEFVEHGLGCRCVADQPWVTVAETCELIMACCNSGHLDAAHRLFADIQRFGLEDGSWWTGYVFEDDLHWPDERPTWTAAAILLAADALYEMTPGHRIFKNHG